MRWPADRLNPDAYVAPGIDLPVFYGHLDTNGHVNNVSLGRYFEQARYTLHRHAGMDKIAFGDGGGLLVARVAVDYLAEIHYTGEPLHLRVRVTDIGRTSMTEQAAAWMNGSCVALAEVVFAYRKDGAGAPWPEALLMALKKLRPPTSAADA